MRMLPIRFLRQSVGLAVRGFRAGVGGTVRFVWPRRKRRSGNSKQQPGFNDRWSSTITKFSFNPELCSEESKDHCQVSTSDFVGSRQWGKWLEGRGALGVKIYEFAVYVDQNQMRRSSLGNVIRSQGESIVTSSDFYHKLRSTEEVDMSIVVKASRSLPLTAMSSEYEKILKRRLIRVGGRSDDPSLPGFLDMFRHERLPAQVKDNQKNVKRGSTMCFKKRKDGTLTTYANEHKVGVIKSKALCSALFDLYLGDEPVSVAARSLAADRLIDLISNHEKQLQQTNESSSAAIQTMESGKKSRFSSSFARLPF